MSTVVREIGAKQQSDALERILGDRHFSGTGRPREILEYIVAEEMAGGGDSIRAKTIAQDVYDRGSHQGSDPENVVRVDARRLRQALELYSQTAGRNDPVRIIVDTGGYRPRFEPNAAETATEIGGSRSVTPTTLVGFGLGLATGAAFVSALFYTFGSGSAGLARPVLPDGAANVRREALYEKSPASLQALNLAEQARYMIFPIFERTRQELVASAFQQVIVLDPDYSGGYAGAAQALATLAILAPDEEARSHYLEDAVSMAENAVRLAPMDPWSQSARAWVSVAEGDYDEALRLARRASELAPETGHILDFHGAVALFTGAFDEAIGIANRTASLGGSHQRFANRNISGAVNFHLGNYEQTIRNMGAAAQFGDPLSAPSLAYHAAALMALGRPDEARAKIGELERAWPDAPVDRMLYNIHGNDEHASEVIALIVEAGWSPGTKSN